MNWRSLLTATISTMAFLSLTACAVTFPLGDGAKYGELQVTAIYRPPAVTSFPNILNQPALRGK